MCHIVHHCSIPHPVLCMINPSVTAPACKIFPGWKMHGYTSTFNAVRFDENPFSCQCQKEDKKTCMLKFRTLLVVFMWQWRDWNNYDLDIIVQFHRDRVTLTVIYINPFTAPASKIPGWKVHTYTPANNIFDGPITNLLSILCVLIETFHVVLRRRGKNIDGFKFGIFIGRFPSDGLLRDEKQSSFITRDQSSR